MADNSRSGTGAGTLYVVATPIGHLGDITLRAIETLRSVDRVLAEDTRRSLALLSHLGISGKPVDRLDAHAPPQAIASAIARLGDGRDLAVVTDAGTPLVSDPGAALVAAAIEAGVRVVPIPGASAVMAAVSASGLVTGPFLFLGFLPRSGAARREALSRIVNTEVPVVLFESKERANETLRDLADRAPDRAVAICRELTKEHEEIVRGALRDFAANDAARAWIGEITLVLGAAPAQAEQGPSAEEIDRFIDAAIASGRSARDVANEVSAVFRLARRDAYQRVIARPKA